MADKYYNIADMAKIQPNALRKMQMHGQTIWRLRQGFTGTDSRISFLFMHSDQMRQR